MIRPGFHDVNRRVRYVDPHGPTEEGVISSLSRVPGSVFVIFQGSPQLTPCDRLEWVEETAYEVYERTGDERLRSVM